MECNGGIFWEIMVLFCDGGYTFVNLSVGVLNRHTPRIAIVLCVEWVVNVMGVSATASS
jgi:hypothetical protein